MCFSLNDRRISMLKIDVATAEDIANFIYTESKHHTIICDEQGKIIADTAKTRLGNIHDGSREILTTNIDCMAISTQDEEKSAGKLKAGTHIVIKDGDFKIGSFGIAGDPLYTEALANIARGLVIARLRDNENEIFLTQCSAEVACSLEKATTNIQQLSATSQQLASSSERATLVTIDVNQSIKDTYDILQFIQQIANQTNLLGLNAAIEAARSGEHGRGFAVVAEEIRKLSNESKKAATSINAILSKLRASIDVVIKVSEENNLVAQEQATAVQEMAAMIEDVHKIGLQLVQISTKK